MQFGLYVNPQFQDDAPLAAATGNMAEQVRTARDAGYASIFVPHHYLSAPMRSFRRISYWRGWRPMPVTCASGLASG